MQRSFVGQYVYNDYCRRVRIGDPDLTALKIQKICEFLDGKLYDDNGKIITNILDDFLYQIIRKPYYEPEYSEEVVEFIKSDYYSSKIKKAIYKMTKHLDGYDKVNKLLRSKLHMNEFDLSTLNDINDAFYEYGEKGEIDPDINIKTPIIFNKYMFVLDGYGPVEFIRNNYTKEEIAKEFLINVGLFPVASYYNDTGLSRLDFNEEHLIAIYKEFEKYMPNQKDEFVRFVRLNKIFTPKEFITNYFKFVDNNFSCDSLRFNRDKKELEDSYSFRSVVDEKINDDIKNMFLKYVNKDKELKKTINQ